MSFFNCLRLPVSHSGYWCPTLGISLGYLIPGFPSRASRSGEWFPGCPDASLHWSLFTCLPVWLSTASGVRLSGCLSSLVSIYFPLWLVVSPILAGVVWLSGCLYILLYVSSFMCLPLWLVVSGCPDVFSWLSLGSRHFSLTISLPISPDSSVSQLMCLQSSVCLSGGV